MYTNNLSNLESPHLIFSKNDEYVQDFSTEIDYSDEILSDYANERYNCNELIMDRTEDDFFHYSRELSLSMDYSYNQDDFEYDEVSISNDQIMLEEVDNL